MYNIDKENKMEEVEFYCNYCSGYFEAPTDETKCPFCDDEDIEQTNND